MHYVPTLRVRYIALYTKSLQDLMKNYTHHEDLASMIMEAMGYHNFYKTNVLDPNGKRQEEGRKGLSLASFTNMAGDEKIAGADVHLFGHVPVDGIHRIAETVLIQMPVEIQDDAGDPATFKFDALIEKIEQSLTLYEQMVVYQKRNMQLGIYDPESQIMVSSISLTVQAPETAEPEIAQSSAMPPRGYHLH